LSFRYLINVIELFIRRLSARYIETRNKNRDIFTYPLILSKCAKSQKINIYTKIIISKFF